MIIATRNLENLYRPGGTFGPRDQEVYKAKLASLAATITDSRERPRRTALPLLGQGGSRLRSRSTRWSRCQAAGSHSPTHTFRRDRF